MIAILRGLLASKDFEEIYEEASKLLVAPLSYKLFAKKIASTVDMKAYR